MSVCVRVFFSVYICARNILVPRQSVEDHFIVTQQRKPQKKQLSVAERRKRAGDKARQRKMEEIRAHHEEKRREYEAEAEARREEEEAKQVELEEFRLMQMEQLVQARALKEQEEQEKAREEAKREKRKEREVLLAGLPIFVMSSDFFFFLYFLL